MNALVLGRIDFRALDGSQASINWSCVNSGHTLLSITNDGVVERNGQEIKTKFSDVYMLADHPEYISLIEPSVRTTATHVAVFNERKTSGIGFLDDLSKLLSEAQSLSGSGRPATDIIVLPVVRDIAEQIQGGAQTAMQLWKDTKCVVERQDRNNIREKDVVQFMLKRQHSPDCFKIIEVADQSDGYLPIDNTEENVHGECKEIASVTRRPPIMELGIFVSEPYWPLSQDQVAALRLETHELNSRDVLDNAARARKLACMNVPDDAVDAFHTYGGDAQAAALARDHQAQAAIALYAEAIEAQGLCPEPIEASPSPSM